MDTGKPLPERDRLGGVTSLLRLPLQVVNAVLLLPLLAFMYGISRDHDLMGMGEHAATRLTASAYLVAIVLITACILALGYFSLF